MGKQVWAVVAAALLVGGQAMAGLVVRVDSRGGAPRLMVNGKPVRARMFFGGPGANPIAIGPEPRQVTFEFRANADSGGTGTMHFRFGQQPGEIVIDDVRVTDTATGADVMPLRDFEQGPGSFAANWTYFPPEPGNTVGQAEVVPGVGHNGSAGLRVRLRAPANGKWPDYHVYHVANLALKAGRAYTVTFWCRSSVDRQLSVNFYKPGEVYTHLGGPPSRYESQVKLAAGAGVDFISYIVPLPWPEPGKAVDWVGVDAECDRVLAANPHALLVPRIGMDPPTWWGREHPGDMMAWEDGSHRYTAVPASPLYRREGAERVGALVAHMEAKYGDHVAGYHVCGQNTGEWFYEGTWDPLFSGYAPADAEGFQRWLRARYGTDAALQAAWRKPGATIAEAECAPASIRHKSPNGVLRDPVKERELIDWAAYQQAAMADCVRAFCAPVRRESKGRKLVMVFYGYAFEFGAVALGPAACGHYAMRSILDCPDIDVVCSPISYGDRQLGGTGPVMSCAESVAMAGKMWLQEDDTRTHESPDGPDAIARTRTLEETANVLTRNIANEATRNMATWWMDLGMEGWYDDPGIWNLMKRLAPLDKPFLDRALPFRPQVAAVFDEQSAQLIGAGVMEATNPLTYSARHQLGRMGAPYGQYLLDDVAAGKVKARMLVFLNAFQLTDSRRQELRSVVRGRAAIWSYAPGIYGANGLDLAAARELTGFRLKQVAPSGAMATPTDVGRKLGLAKPWGVANVVTPLFAADDARPNEVLARYADGSVAVAMRQVGGGVSVFCGVPGFTPELLRAVARQAGVHLYSADNALVHANGPIVAVTATRDGSVKVDTGVRGTVLDALSGKPVGVGPVVVLKMRKGDTRALRLGRG